MRNAFQICHHMDGDIIIGTEWNGGDLIDADNAKTGQIWSSRSMRYTYR